MFLSAMFSKKQWRFPNPSAARQTLSPVAVHERHTMSSWIKPIYVIIIIFKSIRIRNNIRYKFLSCVADTHHRFFDLRNTAFLAVFSSTAKFRRGIARFRATMVLLNFFHYTTNTTRSKSWHRLQFHGKLRCAKNVKL